jgi:hypothetical protein
VIYINEWMADNTFTIANPVGKAYEDWFELYNPGTNSVDLGGLFLADSITNKFQFEIPPGYIIPAGGFLLVWADNTPERNGTNQSDLHVNFQLNKRGEAIGLFGPDGTIIDFVAFGQQTNDVSEGRYPDGAANIVYMPTATPRKANVSNLVQGNTPPVLGPLPDRRLVVGQTLSFIITAVDNDTPPQTLTFSLLTNAPTGAILSPAGQFNWTPAPNQAPSTNVISLQVADNGTPPASATGQFTVFVGEPTKLAPGAINIGNGQISFSFATLAGKTYQVQVKNNLNDASWSDLGQPQTATGAALSLSDNLQAHPQRFYRIRVGE